MGPKSSDRYPYKRKERAIQDRDTEEKAMCRWRQGLEGSRKTRNSEDCWQLLGDKTEDGTHSPSETPEGTNRTDALISAFLPAQLWENKLFPLFWSTKLW